MPVVTDIQRQRKRPNRYSIFVDGEYSFSLSDLDFSLSGLEVEQTLTADQLDSFQFKSIKSKAYEQAVRFLSYRQRTGHEMRNFLKRKGHDEVDIQQTLKRLQKAGLVDDTQFAKNWVATRQSLKPRSKRRLIMELKEKGLDENVIEVGLKGYDQEAELDSIKKIANKKLTRESANWRSQDQRKLIDYLVRQGFDYYLVKQALGDLDID